MSYKDKYLRRDTFYGDSIRNIRIHETKNKLSELMYDSPNYFNVTKYDSNKTIDVIITDDSDNQEMKAFVAKIDEDLFVGDSFFWNGQYWMVSHYDEIGEIYKSGKLRLAVSSLKWQNPNGELLEYPFIFNSDNLSNFGVDEGKVISLLNDRRNIAIHSSIESKEIKVGQRFIFDDAAWKVVSINRLNPLIEIILESDIIDTVKDNMDLRIADYVKPNYSILVNPSSVSMNVSDTLMLDVKVLNNGTEIVSPDLTYISSDNDVCSVDTSGVIEAINEGTAVIAVVYKNVSINIDVTVSQVPVNNYSVIIAGDSTVYRARTKVYSCTFYDNGSPIDMSGAFRLTDVNGNPTSAATITQQSNNTCTVRGDALGTVILHVIDSTGTIKAEKSIQIKSAL